MSTHLVQWPVYVVRCEGSACLAEFRPTGLLDAAHEINARAAAGDAGWQVRPNLGKGSRTAPDLCPSCRDMEKGGGNG